MSAETNQDNSKVMSETIRDVLRSGSTAVLITLLDLPEANPHSLRIGAKLLVQQSKEKIGSLGDSQLDNAAALQAPRFLQARDDAGTLTVSGFAPELMEFKEVLLLFERIEAEPHLIIAGAGHVGAALARLAAVLGYRVTLIDDRGEFLTRDLFASAVEQGIALVVAESWSDAVRAAIGNGRGASVAIVTRGHKQDEDCLRAAIAANPDYIGMIGSKRRTNIVLDKLRGEGADEDRLKKVHAPIGLDIGAVSPEEVALAILAEVVSERRGGSSAPLSSWRRENRTP
jgi:xanthine dehydrogenase accessory factor